MQAAKQGVGIVDVHGTFRISSQNLGIFYPPHSP